MGFLIMQHSGSWNLFLCHRIDDDSYETKTQIRSMKQDDHLRGLEEHTKVCLSSLSFHAPVMLVSWIVLLKINYF